MVYVPSESGIYRDPEGGGDQKRGSATPRKMLNFFSYGGRRFCPWGGRLCLSSSHIRAILPFNFLLSFPFISLSPKGWEHSLIPLLELWYGSNTNTRSARFYILV